MKKLILIFLMSLVGQLAFSQSKSVDALCQKYKAHDDFFHMDIGGNFMNFANGFNVKLDQANMEGIVKSLDKVKLFKLPENSANTQTEFKVLQKSLEKERYELLMETRDKGNGILIYTKGNNVINDVVVMLNDKDGDMIVVELLGSFDSKMLANAGKGLK